MIRFYIHAPKETTEHIIQVLLHSLNIQTDSIVCSCEYPLSVREVLGSI